MATKTQTQFAYHQLGQTLRSLESDLRWGLEGSMRIPVAWHEIAQEAASPAKTQITLRLDEDVLKFFRSMGRGYYGRINAVLRAFMLARLAEVVKALPEYQPTEREEELHIRAEVGVIIEAQIAAREAAEAALIAAPKVAQRLRDAKAMHAFKRSGQ